MPVNLSIKNVPDELAARLRERAARSHRSLQGELIAILEDALAPAERLSPSEALKRVRAMGLRTPTEASAIIRADRNAR
jgi:plasmid stability protein